MDNFNAISWINTLPFGWKAVKLKYLLEQRYGSMKVGPFGSQLSGKDFTNEGYWVYNQKVVVNQNFDETDTFINEDKYNSMSGFQVNRDDILITTRGTIGRICRIPKTYNSGIIHPCIIKFRIDEEKVLYDLINLLFNESNMIKDQLNFMSNATTIDVIYSGTLKNVYIPIAPLNIQYKLISYLKDKCFKIDAMTTDIQSEIDMLEKYKRSVITEAVTKGVDKKVEMKDSGIEWIGKIPKSWEIIRLRYVADFYNGDRGVNYPSGDEFVDGGIPFLTSNNIHSEILDVSADITKYISKEKYQILGGAKIELGDIIFCLRGSVGNCAVNKTIREGTVASSLVVIRSKKISPDFLNYVLNSPLVEIQTRSFMNGSCAANLSAENVSSYLIVFPSRKEQEVISSFLNVKCEEINSIISGKQKQLEILDSYKKSLIYEYVTGKKEVPSSWQN